MKNQDWRSIRNFTPGDFEDPAKLELSIIDALDRFSTMIGKKPIVISDYRAYDPKNPTSQHSKGKAIDTVWIGADPLTIYEKATGSNLFGGVGIYINPTKSISFHFDTRPLKSDGSLAKWGGVITRPDGEKHIEYTGASVVLEKIPGIGIAIPILLLIAYFLWRSQKK